MHEVPVGEMGSLYSCFWATNINTADCISPVLANEMRGGISV